jgi:hypothetical protein
LQKGFRAAARKARTAKPVGPRPLRHCLSRDLLAAGYDIRRGLFEDVFEWFDWRAGQVKEWKNSNSSPLAASILKAAERAENDHQGDRDA